MKILIRDILAILPDGEKVTSVLVEDGTIASVGDTPPGVKADSAANRFCQLWFVDDDLPATWDDGFATLGDRFSTAGLGEFVLVAPFRATVPGTDTYTDELW